MVSLEHNKNHKINLVWDSFSPWSERKLDIVFIYGDKLWLCEAQIAVCLQEIINLCYHPTLDMCAFNKKNIFIRSTKDFLNPNSISIPAHESLFRLT